MDTDYLYKWVSNQLSSGIPESEIVNNIVNYAKLSRDEAVKYVKDSEYRDNFKLQNNAPNVPEPAPPEDPIVSKLSGIENELKEMNTSASVSSWVIFGFAFGLFIGWLIWGSPGC